LSTAIGLTPGGSETRWQGSGKPGGLEIISPSSLCRWC